MKIFKSRSVVILFLFLIPLIPIYGDDIMDELELFRKAYPEVNFSVSYDNSLEDWRLRIETDDRVVELIRSDGSYVMEEQWSERENYRHLIYRFPLVLRDPEDFSPEIIERIRNFGSTDSRKNQPVTNTAFFDAIYDTSTRSAVESHLVTIEFLGLEYLVHEKMKDKLANVERRIRARAETDPEVAEFLDTVNSGGGYHWRQVEGTNGKSFHSMGLAIDLLPPDWWLENIFWLTEKKNGNADWMLVPLDERWMPPMAVVEIFEDEGFIWGGKWALWDTMHFEYRPELIYAREIIFDGHLSYQ